MGTLVSAIGTIAVVVLILFLAWWTTKLIARLSAAGAGRPAAAQRRIQVLEQLSGGKDQKLQLVSVGGRWFLLGWTAQHVTVLAEFTAEEAQSWTESDKAPAAQQAAPDFRGILLNFRNKKNQ